MPLPVPTPNPTNWIQFNRLAPLLYSWHVPQPAEVPPHTFIGMTTPCLPNVIRIINSQPPHEIFFDVILLLLFQNPSPITSKVDLKHLYQGPCSWLLAIIASLEIF